MRRIKVNIVKNSVKRWANDIHGAAVAEFALVFPIMMTLLFGVYEVGTAITVNQKAITASQIMADLLSRNSTVDDSTIDNVVRAGELAMAPFDLTDFGVDIVSLRYDQNDNPEIVWRETRNMTEDTRIMTSAEPLGTEGDGALAVVVEYVYRPVFGWDIIEEVDMREATFARGRRSAVVTRN